MFDRMPPVHPGEILLEEFLKPIGLSQTQLALATGMPQSRVQAIVAVELQPIRQFALPRFLATRRSFGSTARPPMSWTWPITPEKNRRLGMWYVRIIVEYLVFLFKVFGEFASRTVFHRIVPCRFGCCARHFFGDGKRGRRFGVHYGSG